VAVWVAGFTIETLADKQLRQFISNPANKGHLMTRGLWRYSRHPNYFGELTMWWGLGIIALGVPNGLIGLLGPALISHLIIFVSGIPPTEKAFQGRIGWDEYKRRTSVLVPWFVRQKDAS
jgi:steroid 5-alpha reductase family enzyme